MSNKLNFANVSEAYNIASEQIKSRQDQIDKLKKIINENSDIIKTNKDQNIPNIPNTISQLPVGPIQPVQPVQPVQKSEDFEYSFYKLASNPKFDQAVQNYIILKQPTWINRMNNSPMNPMNQMNQMNQMNKSNFGNFDSTDIKHYIIFFLFSIIVYLMLGILIKK